LKVVDQDGVQIVRFGPGNTQAASLAQTFVWAAGLGVTSVNGPQEAPLPVPPVVITAGWSLQSQTTNIDVGDAYTGIVAVIREWSAWDVAMFSVYEDEQLAAEPVYP